MASSNLDKYVTPAMIRHVQKVIEFCRVASIGADEVLIEERVILPKVGYGTVDYGVVFGLKKKTDRKGFRKCDLIHIIDLKYGQGVAVDAEGPQTPYYALGFMATRKYRPKKIKVTIHQPRLGTVSSKTYTYKEIMVLYKMLKKGVKKVEKMDRWFLDKSKWHKIIFKAGNHCGFCLAKHQCRTLRNFIVDNGPMTTEGFTKIQTISTMTDKDRYVEGVVNMMEGEELAQWYHWCDLAKRTATAVHEKLTKMAARGYTLKGLKLVAGRRSSKWKDPTKAAIALKLTGLVEADIYEKKMISPSKARDLTNVNEALVNTTEGKATLVGEADRRKSLDLIQLDNAMEGFDVVE